MKAGHFSAKIPGQLSAEINRFEASRCGRGIRFDNTSDCRVFGGTVQNCTNQGFYCDHEAIGNKYRGYLEANGVDSGAKDIAWGVEAYGNQVWAGGLVAPTVDDASTNATGVSQNIVHRLVDDGTDRQYVPDRLGVWNASVAAVDCV